MSVIGEQQVIQLFEQFGTINKYLNCLGNDIF